MRWAECAGDGMGTRKWVPAEQWVPTGFVAVDSVDFGIGVPSEGVPLRCQALQCRMPRRFSRPSRCVALDAVLDCSALFSTGCKLVWTILDHSGPILEPPATAEVLLKKPTRLFRCTPPLSSEI
jgi:hypothetical protein